MSMKNEALYNRTVDVLVQAYFDDTLQHKNCAACAVGNLVAAALGYSFRREPLIGLVVWRKSRPYHKPLMSSMSWFHLLYWKKKDIDKPTKREAKKQIAATGYSIDELTEIESAFEGVSRLGCTSEDDYMFKGLMAVIDVLDQIHENTDQQLTTVTKTRFQKAQI